MSGGLLLRDPGLAGDSKPTLNNRVLQWAKPFMLRRNSGWLASILFLSNLGCENS